MSLTGDDVVALGKSVLEKERDFNLRAGFTQMDDRLPRYFSREKLPPHDVVFDVPEEELDKVFNW
jgi:aldehyde:ferredoxin oxidoreductase